MAERKAYICLKLYFYAWNFLVVFSTVLQNFKFFLEDTDRLGSVEHEFNCQEVVVEVNYYKTFHLKVNITVIKTLTVHCVFNNETELLFIHLSYQLFNVPLHYNM